MALIEVKNVIKTYATGEAAFNALNDVSLTIEEGEFVAIMGASGSGKSTFMNMLGTLDKPNSGSYYLDGIDVLHLNSEKLSEIRKEDGRPQVFLFLRISMPPVMQIPKV